MKILLNLIWNVFSVQICVKTSLLIDVEIKVHHVVPIDCRGIPKKVEASDRPKASTWSQSTSRLRRKRFYKASHQGRSFVLIFRFESCNIFLIIWMYLCPIDTALRVHSRYFDFNCFILQQFRGRPFAAELLRPNFLRPNISGRFLHHFLAKLQQFLGQTLCNF